MRNNGRITIEQLLDVCVLYGASRRTQACSIGARDSEMGVSSSGLYITAEFALRVLRQLPSSHSPEAMLPKRLWHEAQAIKAQRARDGPFFEP